MKILALILLISALLDTVVPIVKLLKFKKHTQYPWVYIIDEAAREGVAVNIVLNILAIVFFIMYLI